jgi:diamine N-acetyltransferase
MEIRQATVKEIPIIQKIVAVTWPVAYGHIISDAQIDYMLEWMYNTETLTKQMQTNHQFLLATDGVMPAGFAGYSPVDEELFKLHKLYVLPVFQGKAVGKLLLQAVEKNIAAANGKELQLNVNRANNARYFYEKNGFQILKEENIDIGNGYFMNDYVMAKAIE